MDFYVKTVKEAAELTGDHKVRAHIVLPEVLNEYIYSRSISEIKKIANSYSYGGRNSILGFDCVAIGLTNKEDSKDDDYVLICDNLRTLVMPGFYVKSEEKRISQSFRELINKTLEDERLPEKKDYLNSLLNDYNAHGYSEGYYRYEGKILYDDGTSRDLTIKELKELNETEWFQKHPGNLHAREKLKSMGFNMERDLNGVYHISPFNPPEVDLSLIEPINVAGQTLDEDIDATINIFIDDYMEKCKEGYELANADEANEDYDNCKDDEPDWDER